MNSIKKVTAIGCSVLLIGASSVSANWQWAGYDTTDLDNIGKVYNEVIGGKYTSKMKSEALPEKDIVWVEEGYELEYPHAGYDRLYLEGNKQQITRYNNLFPQWETRFADYFWELYGDHRIYQRQQTKIPGLGWKWDYSDISEIDNTLFVPTTRNAVVVEEFRVYGVGPYNLNGWYVSDEVAAMYARFGVDNEIFNVIPDTKEIEEGTFFHSDNLSQIDGNGHYLVSDEEIAAMAGSIQAKFITGPSYRGDNPTKNVAAEYLAHGDAWQWDDDTLRYGGGKVEWTGVMYEIAEPYKMYQYLIINGVIFDGHNELPRIYRYTGGKASPNVQWKYAFAEKDGPFQVVEFKYVDGKLAIDEVTGEPIYRVPTGKFANIYVKTTATELQYWLKDDNADVLVARIPRTDHDLGYYAGYMGGANLVSN